MDVLGWICVACLFGVNLPTSSHTANLDPIFLVLHTKTVLQQHRATRGRYCTAVSPHRQGIIISSYCYTPHLFRCPGLTCLTGATNSAPKHTDTREKLARQVISSVSSCVTLGIPILYPAPPNLVKQYLQHTTPATNSPFAFDYRNLTILSSIINSRSGRRVKRGGVDQQGYRRGP